MDSQILVVGVHKNDNNDVADGQVDIVGVDDEKGECEYSVDGSICIIDRNEECIFTNS